MSYDWVSDIADMHAHYKIDISNFDRDKIKAFLEFRIKFLQEELDEMKNALATDDAEEIVDALIDLSVVAIGTLDLLEVNPYLAWDEVYAANMSKQVGIKESRPNPLGLPDLIKPEGWQAPSHGSNHGLLNSL